MKVVFKAPSRFDAESVAVNRQIIERLGESDRDVIVDMSDVELIDGSGFGAIAHLHKRLARLNHTVRVINVGGQPRDLMAKTGLLRVLGATSAIETDVIVVTAAPVEAIRSVDMQPAQKTAA